MGGRRFDVHVPDSNMVLLEQLALEHEKTGIAESRLLIQFATRHAEMMAGKVIPLVASTVHGGAPTLPNGHLEPQASYEMPFVLSSSVLDSFDD